MSDNISLQQSLQIALGGEVPPDALDAVTALIWRAVLLWVAVLALLWLGSL